MENLVPLDDDTSDVYIDEGEVLGVGESVGWHPHHGAQHVFANGNGVQDDRSTLGVDELLTDDNWAELSDDDPAFPPVAAGLKAGDELEVNWGHQPSGDPETRFVDFVIEHGDWWTLHAWLHFDNPEGLFAPFNHTLRLGPATFAAASPTATTGEPLRLHPSLLGSSRNGWPPPKRRDESIHHIQQNLRHLLKC